MTEKKFAIFGTTPSRMEGPWKDDSGWQRWTIGPGGKDTHNWDRLYELHRVWPVEFAGYLNDLSKEKREVWFLDDPKKLIRKWQRTHKLSDEEFKQKIEGDFATGNVLPREELEEKYGRTWFSSSISWLQAHAIEEGATDIGLWGIDLESGEEYTAQFIGCRYFIDVARLVGINVHIPEGSGLLREPRPYPDRYETIQALHMEKKAKYIDQMIGQINGEFEGVRAEVYRQEGRILTYRELNVPLEVQQPAERRLIELNSHLAAATQRLHHIYGERAGTEYWRKIYVYNHLDPDQMT